MIGHKSPDDMYKKICIKSDALVRVLESAIAALKQTHSFAFKNLIEIGEKLITFAQEDLESLGTEKTSRKEEEVSLYPHEEALSLFVFDHLNLSLYLVYFAETINDFIKKNPGLPPDKVNLLLTISKKLYLVSTNTIETELPLEEKKFEPKQENKSQENNSDVFAAEDLFEEEKKLIAEVIKKVKDKLNIDWSVEFFEFDPPFSNKNLKTGRTLADRWNPILEELYFMYSIKHQNFSAEQIIKNHKIYKLIAEFYQLHDLTKAGDSEEKRRPSKKDLKRQKHVTEKKFNQTLIANYENELNRIQKLIYSIEPKWNQPKDFKDYFETQIDATRQLLKDNPADSQFMIEIRDRIAKINDLQHARKYKVKEQAVLKDKEKVLVAAQEWQTNRANIQEEFFDRMNVLVSKQKLLYPKAHGKLGKKINKENKNRLQRDRRFGTFLKKFWVRKKSSILRLREEK